MLIGFGVAAVFDHGARGGVLQSRIVGIDRYGAGERCNGVVFLSCFRGGTCDAGLEHSVIRIQLGGAQERGEIGFVGAESEVQLVEAAPQDQQSNEAQLKCRGRQELFGARGRGDRHGLTRNFFGDALCRSLLRA